jgi:hypothetical protein
VNAEGPVGCVGAGDTRNTPTHLGFLPSISIVMEMPQENVILIKSPWRAE